MTSVSVIVPTYNCGQFIGQAIDSILGQTRPPEQIIVVDDGSTDDTEQVVRRYEHQRIEYIRQANAGVSAARNAGLDAAVGDLVTFLDADDRWRPTFVEHMRGYLIANPAAVCAFANFVRFDHETGDVLKDQFAYYPELQVPLQDEPTAAIRSIPKEYAFSALIGMGDIPAFTVVMMFRRSMIDGLAFDASLKVCEDTHFALRAFMRGDVPFTSEILCEVRRHGNNATREHHAIAVHKLRALKALAPFVSGNANLAAYRDRLVKAHVDAAIYQTKSGHIRVGLRSFLDGFIVPSSPMRKLKGSVWVALALPRGLMST
jgi:glycosyltransferase involved in cell wall biosynthesis